MSILFAFLGFCGIADYYHVDAKIGRHSDIVAAAALLSPAVFAGLCFIASGLSNIAETLGDKKAGLR